MSHQVCNVPKEGHFYARVRALLCHRETQWCTSKTPPVNPKHRFLSFGDTSRKQVFSTSVRHFKNHGKSQKDY